MTRPRFVVDLALAGGIAAGALLLLLAGPQGVAWRSPDRVTVLLVVVAVVPYLLRSRSPLTALVLAALTLVALTEHGDSLGVLGAGAFFLVYTVAAWSSRRQVAVAALVVVAFLGYLAARAPERMTIAALLNNVLLFAGAFAVGDWVRQRREQMAWTVERAALVERDRAGAAAQAVAEERLTIARDLHDITAHSLGVIAVQAGVAAHVIDREPAEARAALLAINRTSRDALDEIRALVASLRSNQREGYHPTPRLADLPALVAQAQAAGQSVQLRLSDFPGPIPASIDVAVYRVVQEALTNARLHAPGAPVTVVVGCDDSQVSVAVTNEPAIAPAQAGERRGHGLVGMTERVHLAGGALRWGPDGTGGFAVAATFPRRVRA